MKIISLEALHAVATFWHMVVERFIADGGKDIPFFLVRRGVGKASAARAAGCDNMRQTATTTQPSNAFQEARCRLAQQFQQ